jgi:hypothetical protein
MINFLKKCVFPSILFSLCGLASDSQVRCEVQERQKGFVFAEFKTKNISGVPQVKIKFAFIEQFRQKLNQIFALSPLFTSWPCLRPRL